MGLICSCHRGCCSSGRMGHHAPGDTPLADSVQVHDVVVLREGDLRGERFKQLLESKGNATHVRFDLGQRRTWIPTDHDLARLKALQQLTCVDLSGCEEITRRGLEYVSLRPGQIRVLILNDCFRITDKFFDQIVLFSHLERLHVRGCFRISDHGVEALTALRHLRHLDLSTHATECEMMASAQSGCGAIKNGSMIALGRMTQLETLQLECCSLVSDEGLVRLATLGNLRSLNLYATGLTDMGLRILSHFPKLRSLNVGHCYVSESQALQYLLRATKLTDLNVSRVPGVTDKLVQGIAKHLDLKHLDISGCDHLSDDGFKHLSELSSLMYLNANACPGNCRDLFSILRDLYRVVGLGISGASVRCLSSLSNLCSLHISEACKIHRSHILQLAALQRLEMGAGSAETQQLYSTLRTMTNLTDLTLHLPSEDPSTSTQNIGIKIDLLKKGAETDRHCPESLD